MNKARRQTKKFVNYLFEKYKVPRIPVYIHWHHNSVVINEEGDCGFGVFCWGGGEKTCIHVAGKVIGKTGVLSALAHEFVHYIQYLHDFDFEKEKQSEKAAEHFGSALLGQWLVNKKEKNIRIDGTLEVWKEVE